MGLFLIQAQFGVVNINWIPRPGAAVAPDRMEALVKDRLMLNERLSSHSTASSSRPTACSSVRGGIWRQAAVAQAGLRGTRRGPEHRQGMLQARGFLDPVQFEPHKLTVQFVDLGPAGKGHRGSRGSSSRRYTLTHNDITGALCLTVGSEYNYKQISGFYTRLLRDEVVAEWVFDPKPSLHLYVHVSGEERWLAPPFFRNYIFRREIPLVLDSFIYADRELLAQRPELENAEVFVHFQSSVQELDTVELWGILGQRSTWQPVPTSVLKRWIYSVLGLELPEQSHTTPARRVQLGSSIGGLDRQSFTSTFSTSRRAVNSSGSQAPQVVPAAGASDRLALQSWQAAPSAAGGATLEPQPRVTPAVSAVAAGAGAKHEPLSTASSTRPPHLALEAASSTAAVLNSAVDGTLQCQSSTSVVEANGSQEQLQPAIASIAQEVVVLGELQLTSGLPGLPPQQPTLAAARKVRHRHKVQEVRPCP